MAEPWTERIAPDEAERFERYAAELRALQHGRGAARGRVERGLHVKPHVGAVGRLDVGVLPDGLGPAFLAAPGTWSAFVRFSNGGPDHKPDKASDVRGLAIKLVGVPGAKIIPGLEAASTQDFLFIHVPAIGVRDPDEFVTLVRLAARGPALLVPRLIAALGFRRALAIVRAVLGMPKVRSMATTRFYTAAPIRFGAAAVKLALFPEQVDVPRGPGGRDALRADLVQRLARGDLAWRLMAQCFVDEATTPIEDAARPWPEALAPFVELGRLVVPQQDIRSPRGAALEAQIESLSFDPWHAVPELRPLGAIMRARAVAYRESVLERGAAPEPDGVPSA
jgi:hypothetical protein